VIARHHRSAHGALTRITGRAAGGLFFALPLGRFRAGDRVA
jgi:hypothetical protein